MRIQAEARREAQTRAQPSHKQHRTNSWHFLFGCSCSCSGDEHPNFPSSSAEREYYSKSLCIGIWLISYVTHITSPSSTSAVVDIGVRSIDGTRIAAGGSIAGTVGDDL